MSVICSPKVKWAHHHEGMAEALYVVGGDFINEGKQYQAGTSLHFKAGKAHGPHSTKNGCKLLVLWTERSSKSRPISATSSSKAR